jgi:signal transduction histidine kinase
VEPDGEVAQKLADARRSAARLEVLYQSSHAFAEAVGNGAHLLETIALTCSRLLGDFTAITLPSAQGGWLEHVCVYHPDPDLEAAYRHVATAIRARVGEGITGQVIRDNRAMLMPEIDPQSVAARAPEGYKEIARKLNVRSYIGVPMRARGKVIGALSMARGPGAPYGQEDLDLLQDLADRAALALENTQLYEDLEERVMAATAQLRATNQELEAFGYSVAHELRAPLRAIDGFSKALVEDYGEKLDDQAKAFLGSVRDGAARMSELIDALLLLARVSHSELVRQPVDLTRLAHEVVDRLRRSDPSRNVVIHVQEGVTANADPRLIGAVLENLLGNAWKYTKGVLAPRIEFGARQGSIPEVYFVSDNGAGFDAKYAHRLFGVFQRLHSESEFEGVGVGLATVRRIVRLHGGDVTADGAEGSGAVFSFTVEAMRLPGRSLRP